MVEIKMCDIANHTLVYVINMVVHCKEEIEPCSTLMIEIEKQMRMDSYRNKL